MKEEKNTTQYKKKKKTHQDNLVKYLSEHVLHLTSLSTTYPAEALTHTALSHEDPGCQKHFQAMVH